MADEEIDDLVDQARTVDGGNSAHAFLDRLSDLLACGLAITISQRDRLLDAIRRGSWHSGKAAAAFAKVHRLAGTNYHERRPMGD